MDIPKDIYQRITKKHGTILNLQNNPAILDDILRELRSIEHDDFADYQKKTASPFNVPWMDSWAANWLLHQQSSSSGQSEKEFNAVMRQLVDLKLRERLRELRQIIGASPPPDPDPGLRVPPPDPEDPDASFKSPTPLPPDPFRAPPPPDPEDPDASLHVPPPDPEDPEGFRSPPPPDPEDPDASFRWSPPPPDPDAKRFSTSRFNPVTEPPDGGPPEPGVPDPPDPGPDPGPDGGALRDNPWILYWFVSINAPLILNMIDAHITRRLNDLKMQTRKK